MQDKAIIKVKVVERGGKVVYGTAYRINQTHAITALHVVEKYQSITFVFNDGSDTNNFTPDYENIDYDIALITFPENILNSLPEIRTTEINKAEVHNDWNGAGYPRYAKEGSCRPRKQLKGSCNHCPEDENFFDIDCVRQPKLKKWGGVSGAPVFVGNKIVGVICRFDTDLKNTHFEASAIWKLLTDEKFIQYYYVERSSSVYKEKLSELLATHKDLKDELIEILSASKESVLDKILIQGKHAIMDMCLSLQKRSKKPEGIDELLLYSMAYQYENDDCFSQQVTDAKFYIDVPVVRVEACEFLMASADQRKPLFKKKRGPSGQQEVIPGKYSIVAPPEYGIESRAHEDIMDNLLAGHGDYESVVERVFGDYRRASGRQYDKQMKEKVVIAMLKKSEGTYYWLLEVSDRNHSELKKVFNSSLPIKILNMSKDPDVEIDMAEESLFSKLGNFIKD